jgi:hypothetical protein
VLPQLRNRPPNKRPNTRFGEAHEPRDLGVAQVAVVPKGDDFALPRRQHANECREPEHRFNLGVSIRGPRGDQARNDAAKSAPPVGRDVARDREQPRQCRTIWLVSAAPGPPSSREGFRCNVVGLVAAARQDEGISNTSVWCRA